MLTFRPQSGCEIGYPVRIYKELNVIPCRKDHANNVGKWLDGVPVGQVILIEFRKFGLPVTPPFFIFRVSPPNIVSTFHYVGFENVFSASAGTGFHSHLIIPSDIFQTSTVTPLPLKFTHTFVLKDGFS